MRTMWPFGVLSFGGVGSALAADGQVRPRPVPPGVAGAAPAAAGKADAPDEAAVDVPRAVAVPQGPRHIRLHLLDGSVISGDLSVSEISVETDFGKLVVPIDRLRSFTPGLDSNTKLAERIDTLIKNLGSDDYQTREQAHKELAALGRKAQRELARFAGDENAEIKRHVSEIMKEIEELAEEMADDEEARGRAAVDSPRHGGDERLYGAGQDFAEGVSDREQVWRADDRPGRREAWRAGNAGAGVVSQERGRGWFEFCAAIVQEHGRARASGRQDQPEGRRQPRDDAVGR